MFVKKTALGIAFVSLLGCILFLQLKAIWPFTLDDMYITLRYAQHWANGDGLLWNIGAEPVEGYSNFLLVVIATLFIKVGIEPVVGLKILGIVGLFFTVVGIYCLSRLWFSPKYSLCTVIWLLIYRDEMIWVSSGLETMLYQAFVVFSVFFISYLLQHTKSLGSSHKHFSWVFLGLLLSLASYTRPEGIIWGAFILGLAIIQQCYIHYQISRRMFGFQLMKGWWLATITFVLFVGPYFFWRWQYYGLLLPNTVYCKGFANNYFLMLDKAYLQFAWPFFLLGFAAQWLTKDIRLIFLWAPSVLYLFLLMHSDPVSAFDQRLFLPVIPLLFPLGLLGIQTLLNWAWRHHPSETSHEKSLIFVAILCCFTVSMMPMASLQSLQGFTEFPQQGTDLRREVVQWLQQYVQPEDRVVLADSGYIPYYVHAQFDDSYCLNNRWMAKQPFDKMFERYCSRILSQRPRVIILSSLQISAKNTIYTPTDACLNRYLPQGQDYKREKIFSTVNGSQSYRYEVYTLKR